MRSRFGRLLRWTAHGAALFASLLCVDAQASTFSSGTSNCSSCHGQPPNMLSQSATTGKIIPAVDDGALVQSCKSTVAGGATNCSLRQKITNNVNMGAGVANNFNEDELEAIRLYLIEVRDTTVTNTAPAFATTPLTSSSTATFSVQIANYRGLAVDYAFTTVGGAAADFSVISQTPSPLSCPAGQVPATASASPTVCTVSVTVQFQPAATGLRSTTLRLVMTAADAGDPNPNNTSDKNISLSATAISPFQISATTLNFGSVTATDTAVRSAIIQNIGGASFSLGAFTFGGISASLYSLAPTNACTAGLSLAAGAQCQLDVRFAPLVAGSPLNASLSLTHGAAGSPQVISLLGAATPAPQGLIELSALALAFPDTQLGSSTTQSITVRNIGDAALDFSLFTLGGAAPADFAQTGTCSVGTPLAIGQQCSLDITFHPTALGARSASLTIQSDASNGPATIALSGTAVPVPAPQASLLPATLDFGAQTVGGLYPSRSVTLQNVGTAAMAVSAVTVQGAGFANVSATPCPVSLAPGASCTIDVTYSPVAAGTSSSGTLQVATNAPGSPHTAALAGSGTSATVPVLVWSPAVTRLDFGLVTAGTVSAVQSVMLSNNGPGGVTLNVLNAVGADALSFAVAGGTCQPGMTLFQGQSCRVDVRFAPASAGARSASIQVASTGSFPPALAVVGTGLSGPSPDLALSATTLAFETTRVGAQSIPLDVTLAGTGSGVVRVTALAVDGPYVMQSRTCPGVPFVLQAGGSCTVSVAFQPEAEGDAQGHLSVTSDAVPATRSVALSATGEPKPDLSSGGCSIATGESLADPTLWLLAALSALVLLQRHATRRSSVHAGRRA